MPDLSADALSRPTLDQDGHDVHVTKLFHEVEKVDAALVAFHEQDFCAGGPHFVHLSLRATDSVATMVFADDFWRQHLCSQRDAQPAVDDDPDRVAAVGIAW